MNQPAPGQKLKIFKNVLNFFSEGIDVFSLGFGTALMTEYLYILTQGKKENVYEATNGNGLYKISSTLQRSVC